MEHSPVQTFRELSDAALSGRRNLCFFVVDVSLLEFGRGSVAYRSVLDFLMKKLPTEHTVTLYFPDIGRIIFICAPEYAEVIEMRVTHFCRFTQNRTRLVLPHTIYNLPRDLAAFRTFCEKIHDTVRDPSVPSSEAQFDKELEDFSSWLSLSQSLAGISVDNFIRETPIVRINDIKTLDYEVVGTELTISIKTLAQALDAPEIQHDPRVRRQVEPLLDELLLRHVTYEPAHQQRGTFFNITIENVQAECFTQFCSRIRYSLREEFHVEFEYGESIKQPAAFRDAVTTVKHHGFHVVLDKVPLADLGEIKHFRHFDKYKIVFSQPADDAAAAKAKSIIAALQAHRLIALYVETKTDLKQAYELGFRLFEGFIVNALVRNEVDFDDD